MPQPPRYGIVALLLAAASVLVVLLALFTGGAGDMRESAWADENLTPPSTSQSFSGMNRAQTVLNNYGCPRCGRSVRWGTGTCPACGWASPLQLNRAALPCVPQARMLAGAGPNAVGMAQVAAAMPAEANAVRGKQATVATKPGATLLTPREQNAAGKKLVEGHWLGLEVISLTPELATLYQVPTGESGVLVDEITLESAESGILAGDLLQSIDGRRTTDLRTFLSATERVQEKERAELGVNRRGSKMTFVLEVHNTATLGFAQMEAAQPIQPGALSPHRSRGRPCTDCHLIMQSGGQLAIDAGDIVPNPPAITRGAQALHGNRGECSACHVVK